MMAIAPGTRVYLSCRPVDMRKGFKGLSAQVSNTIRMDPFSGHVFAFRGKRGDYLKLLHWDGTGLCLYAKKLEKGRFVWPPQIDERFQMTAAQLALLLEGMDWRRTLVLPPPQVPRVA
jgi:transposase